MLSLSLCLLPLLASAHPAVSSSNVTCPPDATSPPQILSWHIHTLFWPDGAKDNDGPHSIQAALEFRDDFIDAFDLREAKECDSLQDNDNKLCVFPPDIDPGFGFAAPFITPSWAVFLPKARLAEVYPWFVQHHQQLDILLHPNTGCAVADHTDYASWLGQEWELKLSF